MLRAIVLAALLGGAIGGVFVSALQAVWVTPLILEAETFEAAHSHDQEAGWAPEGALERGAYTVAANLIAAIAYALLLASALSVTGGAGWRTGLMWGLGGFLAFALAPALGLAPEPPGAAAADLASRQIWWAGTAAATAAGLWLVLGFRDPRWAVLGILLIALPHIAGAPQPENHTGLAPEALAHAFATASLTTNFLLWAVLGSATGWFYRRFGEAG